MLLYRKHRSLVIVILSLLR